MTTGVLAALVILAEATLHYFRWREVLQGHDLPRLFAYGLGVIGLMLPFTWWLVLNQPAKAEVIRVLWMVIVAGGLSVLCCYILDWAVDMVWKLRQTSQREKAAMSEIKGGGNVQE